jgi:nitrite reductase/ring-hydroxylating ferredoxin subunit
MTNESLEGHSGAEEAPEPQRQPNLSLVFLGLAAIVTFFGAVGLILYLKPGSDSPAPDIFVAGPLEGFVPGTATYFESEHVHVVRLNDGSLLALYDLGPRMQALLQQTGDEDWLMCRAVLVDDSTNATALGAAPEAFEDRVFREPCHGSTWDATGARLFGPTPGNLDRFPVQVVGGVVQVDVSDRLCANPVSDAAPCLPTR